MVQGQRGPGGHGPAQRSRRLRITGGEFTRAHRAAHPERPARLGRDLTAGRQQQLHGAGAGADVCVGLAVEQSRAQGRPERGRRQGTGGRPPAQGVHQPSSVVAGGAAVVGLMAWKGILANEPVYYGLLASLVAYAAVSLATKPTDAAVLAAWRERLAGRTPQVPVEDTVPVG
jgi:hypothetical protein